MSSGNGSSQNPNRRPRAARDYESDYPPLPGNSQRLPSLRNLHLGRPSFRRIPSSERRERYRAHLLTHVPGDDFDELNHSLEEAGNSLRALLDIGGHHPPSAPMPPVGSPPPPQRTPDQYEEERHEEGRRKRRKVDADRVVSSFAGFSYGKYGQVEPGTLTMKIVSCDGGEFLSNGDYPAENILKEDQSVYCTKSTRCNIVLCHQGATVFNLTELVIKAPGATYSAPVREGMVFVAMDQDDLFSKTTNYQIKYYTRASSRSFTHAHDDRSDNLYWRANRLRRLSQARRGESALLDITAMDDEEDEDGDDYDAAPREARMPLEFTAAAAAPPFRVTTECSEDEADVRVERPLRGGVERPLRIGTLPFERDAGHESDSSDGGTYRPRDDPWEQMLTEGGRHRDRDRHRDRSRTRESSTLSDARGGGTGGNQEALHAAGSGGQLMAPHARFHIEKNRSKCTIRFDPPVSGRFVLLKMWSPRMDPSSNIDIQAVVAKGFAGPRYFPSVTPL